MTKKYFSAPGAQGPYSLAVRAGDYLYISGQIGHTDIEGKPLAGVEAQTKRCLEKMAELLKEAGASFDDVVKTTVFLKSQEDFAKMNSVYTTFFSAPKPARSTVIAGMVFPEIVVEIEAVAYLPGV
ncbi:RidA family protein [Dehalococcoides mccartyi]|uniref:Endoribonuclease L-PSP, putative n=1 Tax=Dehalococcoides mccartyi (strain ATCC BAA-2266 / KCTC 15142 / 195) TaxID=243164 RepID=Q3Z7N2_DEHM1|nr:RidA family protein [Dehalococcoides mccartyi]AAW39685.1 endoribonuclease L-PSP, putative [Dehalococcoides mccartyi 195]